MYDRLSDYSVDGKIEATGTLKGKQAENAGEAVMVDTNKLIPDTFISSNIARTSDMMDGLETKVTKNANIVAGTNTKITYDTKGLVTAGASLSATDIPALDAGKITTGAFADARIPNLNASKVTAGTFADARIPALAISKITGLQTALDSKLNTTLKGAVNGLAELDANGKVPATQLDLTVMQTAIDGKITANPAITGATKTKITYDSKGLVTSGANLTATDIPNLATSKITSGTFADARIPALAISKITGLQTALDSKLNTTLKGAVNGLAELDANGKVPSSQLPSYVDDVLEFANKASFPSTGEAGKIYIAIDDNKTYRWGGSAYVEISPSLALGETSATAYRGDRGKTAYEHVSKTDNPHGVTKTQVGLGNVANVLQYSASNAPPYPVTSVAGKTGAVTLAEADIPALSAGKITSGTFADARIPSLNASKTTSGIFSVDRIPTLATSKISGLDTTLSGINTALDAKQDEIILTPARVLVTNTGGKVATTFITTAEIAQLEGVTSNIQTQLNGKQDKFSLYEHTVRVMCTSGATFGFSLTVLNQSPTAFTLPTLRNYLGSSGDDYKQCSGVGWDGPKIIDLFGVRGGYETEIYLHGVDRSTGNPYYYVSYDWLQVTVVLNDKVRQIV